MAILVSRADVERRMRDGNNLPLGNVIDLAHRRKDVNAKAIAALQREGFSAAQADALAFVGLCGGNPSWVDMQFSKIRPQTIAILEERGLLVRAVERDDDTRWTITGGYVILTKEGVALLERVHVVTAVLAKSKPKTRRKASPRKVRPTR